MQLRQLSDGLADLARASERKRDAALLRATTELFVLDLEHDSDEIRRYEQLALHFLPKVAPEDRAFVAERLAICADAPHAVIAMLARDVIEVASPVIRHSPVLGPIDLLSVIATTDVEHHRMIAQRTLLAPEVGRALRLTGDAGVLAHLKDGGFIREMAEDRPNSRGNPVSTGHSLRSTDHSDPWRFLGLDRRGRLNVIADIASRLASADPAETRTHPDIAFRSILSAARIVGFARSGQLPAIISAISEGLDLTADIVSAAVDDAGGELLGILLKALRLDDVQARQVFLLASPSGRDVHGFFPLSDLYAGMEPTVAATLVAAWRDASAGRTPHHEPHLAENGERRSSTPAAAGRPGLPEQHVRRA
jgi:hypothetical protein